MSETCHRCDIEMIDDGEWFTCPCCRSRTRGLVRQQARHKAHMDELGMTEEQYHEYALSFIDPTPLPDETLEAIRKRMSAEWKPACEHDTNNPWEARP